MPPARRGGVLRYQHPPRSLAFGVLVGLCLALATALVAGAPFARAGELQKDRVKARALAAEVAGLDAQINAAVAEYARATRALQAVRVQIHENRRQQHLSYEELSVARATLAARAVAMYKRDDVTPLDAMFGAADLSDLVTQLTMVRTIVRSDRDMVRRVEMTRRELADRAEALAADEETQQKLVEMRRSDMATIRARLDERRATLAGVRQDIRRLAAAAASSPSPSPTPSPTVEPPLPGGGGSGPWWPLIRAAAAGNGISARGMYRLMMVESGGLATAVGAGGYYGLFQYAPATWKGSWNPWRASRITDGAAQIKATALAIRQGHGHGWWDPSYTWAFEGS